MKKKVLFVAALLLFTFAFQEEAAAQRKEASTGMKAVDLGLSVKWGTMNLGAKTPLENGDYYAWGETEPYYVSQKPLTWKSGKSEGYDWSSYKWSKGDYDKLTKYCPSYKTNYWAGSEEGPDGKTILDPEDDAAHVKLGGKWRMPTGDEWDELINKCDWKWIERNGSAGYIVTGKNGNYIFFPAAGYRDGTDLYDVGFYGRYWSSSLTTDLPDGAYRVDFSSGGVNRYYYYRRYRGLSVRPVYATVSTIDEKILNLEDDANLGADVRNYLEAKEVVEDAVPFAIVDEKPSFMGDDPATTFSRWVGEHLNYPVTYTFPVIFQLK